MFISGLGACFFGLLLGWICYRTLRLNTGASVLAEIAAIIGVLGGAAVLALFKSDEGGAVFVRGKESLDCAAALSWLTLR